MASTQLSIPQRYRSGAELIALLSTSEVEALMESLSQGDESRASNLKQEARKELNNRSVPDLEQIFVTLKSLYAARINGNRSVEKFARDVVRDLKRRKPNMFSSPEGWAGAMKNFESLLQIETFEIAQRERHIRGADDKRFCGAEVLVEFRPVFTGETGDELRKLLVSYRLKIGFHSRGDTHEDLYISLDVNDIQALRESLNQAELQGDVLQRRAKKLLQLGGR